MLVHEKDALRTFLEKLDPQIRYLLAKDMEDGSKSIKSDLFMDFTEDDGSVFELSANLKLKKKK